MCDFVTLELLIACAMSPKVVRLAALRIISNDGLQGLVRLCQTMGVVPEPAKAERILEQCDKHGIHILAFGEKGYPKALAEIDDAPLVLYYKGELNALEQPAVAIVGTRNACDETMTTGATFAAKFAENGISNVSGLALGSDTAGHEGSLSVRGGITVAVLANGLNQVYPALNKNLAARILDQGGALLSDYEPGVKPNPHQLIKRNRIQSGMSQATVILESPVKSGTMYTASYCQEQGRILAAWVGPSNPAIGDFAGNELLINAKGARCIKDLTDISSLSNEIKTKYAKAQGGIRDTLF